MENTSIETRQPERHPSLPGMRMHRPVRVDAGFKPERTESKLIRRIDQRGQRRMAVAARNVRMMHLLERIALRFVSNTGSSE